MQKILTALVTLLLTAPAGAVDLMGVYELAQRNDPEIRAAERRLAAAGEIPVQARSALLPQLFATASANQGQSDPRIGAIAEAGFPGTKLPTTDIDNRNYRLELRQNLYSDSNWGQLARGRAEYTRADYEYDRAWQEFLLRVSERYFDVLTALDSVQFARAEETALRRQFEQAEQRFEVGLAAVTDVHEARAAYDGARARVIVADNDLEDAREALREVTGAWFEEYARLLEDFPLDEPEPVDSSRWVELALEHNPVLQGRRTETEIANADVRIARAGHLPSLDLVAFYNINRNNQFILRDNVTQEQLGSSSFVIDSWQLGLTLTVPIFEGLAVRSRTRQARINLQVANEELDLAQRAVVRETENAFRAVLAGIREVEARHQARVSAESALEATTAGFEVGTRTIVDVLLAEQRLFQAERDYSRARHDFILNHLRLRQAAGLLGDSDLGSVNTLLRH